MKDPEVMDALQEDGVLEAGADGPGVVVDPASQLLCREVRFHVASPVVWNQRASRIGDTCCA